MEFEAIREPAGTPTGPVEQGGGGLPSPHVLATTDPVPHARPGIRPEFFSWSSWPARLPMLVRLSGRGRGHTSHLGLAGHCPLLCPLQIGTSHVHRLPPPRALKVQPLAVCPPLVCVPGFGQSPILQQPFVYLSPSQQAEVASPSITAGPPGRRTLPPLLGPHQPSWDLCTHLLGASLLPPPAPVARWHTTPTQ